MADLLVGAPSIPSVPLNTLLSPTSPRRNDAGSKPSLRYSKSTPYIRDEAGFTLAGAVRQSFQGASDYWLSWKDGLTTEERRLQRLKSEKRQILCLRIKNAETKAQWEAAARDLDALDGNDSWKEEHFSPDYNADLIAHRLRDLDKARASCDIAAMMHLIRTALLRDLGGMDSVTLYRHSFIGTKKLIERYVESAVATIDAVVTQSRYDPSVEYMDLLEGMLYSRQSFGRSALLLSGGGTQGMSHIGVLRCLFESKLLPRIISGASAGSIVCAVLCTRTDEEMPEIMDEFPYGNLAVFEEEGNRDGVLSNLRRLLTEGSWSDIRHLTGVMRELTGDMTFQEAYNRTRRILNICVSSASVHELPRLLNYVTAPNVMIWSAVAASCSLPLVFNSSQILVKDPITGEHHPWNPSPLKYIDGSVDNDLPMTRLAEMFNVNHFIVSQVNPHVVPFLSKDDHLSPDLEPGEQFKAQTDGEGMDWVNTLTTLAKDEALHRLHYLCELGILPNLATKFRSILSQKYSGDITILPEMNLHDLPKLLTNPTPDFMLRTSLAGQRATWPKLSRIRDRCAIELALDSAVHRLRARVVFAESQTDLKKLRFNCGTLRGHQASLEESRGEMNNLEEDSLMLKRERRRSGGNLPAPRQRRSTLNSHETPDSDPRHFRVVASPSSEKPKLKRASRSQIQVPQYRKSPATAGVTGPEALFLRPRSSYATQTRGTRASEDVTDDESQPWFMIQSWQNISTAADESNIQPKESQKEGGQENSDDDLCGEPSATSPDAFPGKPLDDLEVISSSGTDDVSEGLWD